MTQAPTLLLQSPLAGWAMPLEEVPDAVFAGRMLGDGIAIDPTSGALHAPCDGSVSSLAPTGHAISIIADCGAELLIHVGIDTVALKGEGFEPRVAAGRRVRAGELLLEFDLDRLARRATSLVTPLLVTNAGSFEILRRASGQSVEQGAFLMELRVTGAGRAAVRGDRGAAHQRRMRVPLPHGIHARPAGQIVQALRGFDAQVTLRAHGRQASVASAVALMSLGVRRDDEIVAVATGADALAAIEALVSLLGGDARTPKLAAVAHPVTRAGQGEVTASPPARGTELAGVVAAPGMAIGIAAFVARVERNVAERGAGIAHEAAELARARGQVRARLSALAAREQGPRAQVIEAHLAFLDDPTLLASATEAIEHDAGAGYAWRAAIRASIEALRELGDERLLERADDLLDLESQVLAALAGEADGPVIELPETAIVLADELLPSQLVALDATRIAGLATARGGPTSHVAILAAAMGKPMLVGVGARLLAIAPGTPLLLDAGGGKLSIDPPAELLSAARHALEDASARDAAALEAAQRPARTSDGAHVAVLANIGSTTEAATAMSMGAEGCGLLRTEFLFLDRHAAPVVDEQRREYQAVVDAFGGRPVVIRTLDAGADKPIAYLPLPHEDNPALGVRGIRTSVPHPDLLVEQLEALLRVRPLAEVRVMLPMVNDPDEVRRVRMLIDATAARLGLDGRPQLGVMIETPAAALGAARLCEVADFLSIGTNDLTQYTLAIDRTHPALAASLDGLHPAVLRLVATTTAAAAAWNRPVAVCGGLAADPLAVPVLLGLGVHELSVVPRLIPRIKAQVRGLALADCRAAAERALALSSAVEVRTMLRASGFATVQSAGGDRA